MAIPGMETNFPARQAHGEEGWAVLEVWPAGASDVWGRDRASLQLLCSQVVGSTGRALQPTGMSC